MNQGGQDAFVELELSLDDTAYPAVRISRELDCELDLLNAARTDEDRTAAFFHVRQTTAEPAITEGQASRYGDEATVIEQYDDEYILKLILRRSIFETLARNQIPLQSLAVTDGTARFAVTVPPDRSPEQIVTILETRYPAITLESKRTRKIAAPFITQTAFQAVVDEQLTSRQLDALHLAYEFGYFERPQQATQSELAEKMDISSSTFGQHLHAALRKLLAALFTEGFTHDLPAEPNE
ncbi:bacterio-opsin activator domain-containing protein [Haloplanus sp. GCM10025708]|uniref:bacterio-opsin activator domain-containing protein n=1 Tax=Haloferacaceae TaxID=1644056 RepID=UPI003612A8F1